MFDGHGGRNTADYASKYMHKTLERVLDDIESMSEQEIQAKWAEEGVEISSENSLSLVRLLSLY